MICRYCNREIDDNAEFCPFCYKSVSKVSTETEDGGLKFGNRQRAVRADAFKNNRTNSQPMPESDPRPDTQSDTRFDAKPDPPLQQKAFDQLKNIGTKVVTTITSNSDVNTAETGPEEVPEVQLADGEVVVKRYNCADMQGAKGYLTVTNKRLMFNAMGGSSRLHQEVSISSVSGLTCYRGMNYKILRIIIGVIIVISGVGTLLSTPSSYDYYGSYGAYGYSFFGGLIIIAIGLLIIFTGIRSAFQIAVYASDVHLSPIVVGEGPRSLLGNTAFYAIVSTPTRDTNNMLNELGALVQDLQTLGDQAIEKYQEADPYSFKL